MNTNKEQFIIRELQSISVSTSFLGDYIYRRNIDSGDRVTFKKELIAFTDEIVKEYSKKIPDQIQIDHINSIINTFSGYEIFEPGLLNFGVGQKFLNHYLKNLWCIGKLEIPPPHFPVDRRIQEKLETKAIGWTQFEGAQGEEDYLHIMNLARRYLAPTGYFTIAELELDLYYFDGRITDLIKSRKLL